VFLYHGKNDWIVEVEQSRRLVDKLQSVGVDVEYLEVTFGHVATFLFDEKEVGAAVSFLKSRL
jgi:predicted esterase